MKVSAYWLALHTRKHPATIRKRIEGLEKDKKGKVDDFAALEAIYCGITPGNNGFISTPEAVRQLTIAKKEEIDVELQIKRGNWLPKQEVAAAYNELFQSIVGILKAHRRKLGEEKLDEILGQLREVAQETT